MVSSGSRHEISLNLSPSQQVVLAGYTFVSSVWIWRPKPTPVKARITLWRNEKRIGSLQPERRFYAARRQQMMEPGIHWNLLHDWYAVMGEKPDRIVTPCAYTCRPACAGSGWGLLMVCGALLSGWRGGSVMRKLLTALPDGGVNALSGLQDAQTVGRISVAPSGRKFTLNDRPVFNHLRHPRPVVDTAL